jgi:hypothetical protein
MCSATMATRVIQPKAVVEIGEDEALGDRVAALHHGPPVIGQRGERLLPILALQLVRSIIPVPPRLFS